MNKLYRQALFLSIFTIVYNILEGFISMFLGYKDETLSLFGFGIDSFIEVISGLGILLMVLRIKKDLPGSKISSETAALRITGYSFYGLSLRVACRWNYQHCSAP